MTTQRDRAREEGQKTTCRGCQRKHVKLDHFNLCAQCAFNAAQVATGYDDSWRGFLDNVTATMKAIRDDEPLPFERGEIDGEAV